MAKSKYITELSSAQVAANREKVIRLLQSTKRQGIDTVIQFLDDNAFFTGAASENVHDCMYGGLAYHSLLVYEEAKKVWEEEAIEIKEQVPLDSLIIACLLHDVCKVNIHPCEPGMKPQHVEHDRSYHGKRSVDILESIGFQMTKAESLAIRWHMSCYTKMTNLLKGEKIADYKRYAEEYPLVALTIIGDGSAAQLSSSKSATRTTVAQLIESIKEETPKKKTVEYKKLEGKSDIQFLAGKKYRAVLFDLDYFDDQPKEDIAALSDYTNSHDVKVGIVTTENKPVYTKWLKTAPIHVDYIVGGGDIKVSRFKFCKKPEGRPMQVCIAKMDYDAKDVLSVCTKDIDKEASEKAGIDLIVNPNPRELTTLLSTNAKKI